MNSYAVVGGKLILPDSILEDSALVVADGTIKSVVSARELPAGLEVVDASGHWVVPGYVDIHVHGGDGYDYMDGTSESVLAVNMAHARHGTTTIFPTTTTGSPDQIHAMIEACRSVQQLNTGPRLPGVHLYGPFFAADKVGCHSAVGRRSPTAEEYQAYFDTNMVQIATCAAELPGAEAFYATAKEAGCLITCGHSNASWTEMQAGFERGLRHVDHFWCAMSSVPSLRQRLNVPMQASMAEFVLMNQEMSTEVIADGHHLAPELLEFAFKMIGPERLCLVTDCNRALDLPAGEYRFGNQADGSWFRSDSRVGWAMDGSSLASSVVGMDHVVRHMWNATSATLPEVLRMAALVPAQRTGIDHLVGSLETGKKADFLLLDSDLVVQRVFVDGRPVEL